MLRPGTCGSPERLASSRNAGGSAAWSGRASAPSPSAGAAAGGRGRGSICSGAAGAGGNSASSAAHASSRVHFDSDRTEPTSIPLRGAGKGVVDDPPIAVREPRDLRHLGLAEREVEDREIFLEPLDAAGARSEERRV